MDKIIHHVRKHHKKYIFATGAAVGLCIFKITIVIAAFFGISFMTGESNAADTRADMLQNMYKAVNIFYKINDIAHQEVDDYVKAGHFDKTQVEKYEALEEAFHSAENINEKYRDIKSILEFLKEHEEKHKRPGVQPHDDADMQRHEKFEQLLQQFNQIQ